MKNKYKIIKKPLVALDWLESGYTKFIAENIYNAEHENEGTLGHALHCYTGSMSEAYNRFLREANGDIEKLNVEEDHLSFWKDTSYNIKLIYEAFNKNKILENIVLYHYTHINIKELLKLIKSQNGVFELKSFLSTTLIKNNMGIKLLSKQKRFNVVFKINTKQGTNCIPIRWRSGNEPGQSQLMEYEVILEPKSQLKLIKIRKKWFCKIKYELEFETI